MPFLSLRKRFFSLLKQMGKETNENEKQRKGNSKPRLPKIAAAASGQLIPSNSIESKAPPVPTWWRPRRFPRSADASALASIGSPPGSGKLPGSLPLALWIWRWARFGRLGFRFERSFADFGLRVLQAIRRWW
jgi:hypothetical protein